MRRIMGDPEMQTTTTRSDRVADIVARGTDLVKDAIRQGRARTTQSQRNGYTRQLAKDVLSRGDDPRSRCVEQIVALVVDVVQRGKLLDAYEIIWRLTSVAVEAHHQEHGAEPDMTWEEAHLAEEHAEGLVEEAETALVHRPTRANLDRYLFAAAAHEQARTNLNRIVRRMQFAATA
jgi:hypothetical protein